MVNIPQVNGVTFAGCILKKSVTQSIAQGGYASVTWDQEDVDTHAFHDNVINNNRITIPSDGKYILWAEIFMPGSSGAAVSYTFVVRNSSGVVIFQSALVTGIIGQNVSGEIFGTLPCVAGDWFEVQLFHNEAGPKSVQTTSRFGCTFLG